MNGGRSAHFGQGRPVATRRAGNVQTAHGILGLLYGERLDQLPKEQRNAVLKRYSGFHGQRALRGFGTAAIDQIGLVVRKELVEHGATVRRSFGAICTLPRLYKNYTKPYWARQGCDMHRSTLIAEPFDCQAQPAWNVLFVFDRAV